MKVLTTLSILYIFGCATLSTHSEYHSKQNFEQLNGSIINEWSEKQYNHSGLEKAGSVNNNLVKPVNIVLSSRLKRIQFTKNKATYKLFEGSCSLGYPCEAFVSEITIENMNNTEYNPLKVIEAQFEELKRGIIEKIKLFGCCQGEQEG